MTARPRLRPAEAGAVAVAAAVVLAVVLVVVPGAPLRTGAHGVALGRTELGACIDVGRPRTVADLNAVVLGTEDFGPGLGADVGVDHRLPDGRRLWFFGDTLVTGTRLVRNSMLVQAGECLHPVLTRAHAALVPDRADGVGYWPMALVAAPARHPDGPPRVLALMQRVRVDEEGLFGFDVLGPAVAELLVPAGRPPVVLAVHDLGPDDADPLRPVWGAAAVRHGPWLYLYGTSTRELPGIHGYALRVARVRPDRVHRVEDWRYWDGDGWVADPRPAQPLVDEQGGVSRVLSVFRADGRWVVLSKRDEFLGRSIAVWQAAHPWGPFGPAQNVAELPCGANGLLRYMPLAHPDLLPRPGTVVVSYSQNAELEQVCARPSLYRPRFLRVELPAVELQGTR